VLCSDVSLLQAATAKNIVNANSIFFIVEYLWYLFLNTTVVIYRSAKKTYQLFAT
jgi:hypothetical protein